MNQIRLVKSNSYIWPGPCSSLFNEMLKIRRSELDGVAIFALSGRIEEQGVSELQKLIQGERDGAAITLDLDEVRLVDRQAVKFFAACEARGIQLNNCPSYVREWMNTRSKS